MKKKKFITRAWANCYATKSAAAAAASMMIPITIARIYMYDIMTDGDDHRLSGDSSRSCPFPTYVSATITLIIIIVAYTVIVIWCVMFTTAVILVARSRFTKTVHNIRFAKSYAYSHDDNSPNTLRLYMSRRGDVYNYYIVRFCFLPITKCICFGFFFAVQYSLFYYFPRRCTHIRWLLLPILLYSINIYFSYFVFTQFVVYFFFRPSILVYDIILYVYRKSYV